MKQEFQIQDYKFEVFISNDQVWDGHEFNGMFHGILTSLPEMQGAESSFPLYITHVVGDTVDKVMEKARLYAGYAVDGDMYCLIDPAAKQYAELQDTTI